MKCLYQVSVSFTSATLLCCFVLRLYQVSVSSVCIVWLEISRCFVASCVSSLHRMNWKGGWPPRDAWEPDNAW